MKWSKFKSKIRKVFRWIHRDFGYLITGLTLMYALSGLAVNHLDHWDPSYVLSREEVQLTDFNPNDVKTSVEQIGDHIRYRKHYKQKNGKLKVYVKSGTILLDPAARIAKVELVTRRPLFYWMNRLHYNRDQHWIWFADSFSVLLIVVTLTGIFLVKGKNGISKRGLWLTLLGLAIPVIFLLLSV
ncbi:MAG: PepSY-associated TM helix domain-containing protein [Cytophagales bacterium]|nr:PepSY-associated TM helix domain-containing protein [Cytophagales bacterium]